MRKEFPHLKEFLYFLVAIVIAIVAYNLNSFVHVPARTDFSFDSVGQQLGILFFLALVIERVQEVIMASWRGAEGSTNDRKLSELRQTIANRETELAATGTTPARLALIPQEIGTARAAEAAAVVEREDFRGGTQQRALIVGLVLGLITSLLGFRILESIVDLDQLGKDQIEAKAGDKVTTDKPVEPGSAVVKAESPAHRQRAKFRLFDVLLTGMLLAGGSDGIHKIARALTDFAESSSEKSKKSAAVA